jgi:hypothetical protein
VPVTVERQGEQLVLGMDPTAVPAGTPLDRGTLTVDAGRYWFQLQAIVRRGTLIELARPGPLARFVFHPRSAVAWDYSTLHREAAP